MYSRHKVDNRELPRSTLAMTVQETQEVSDLYDGVKRALDYRDDKGRKIGGCKQGVYLFYDYDGEPIYVGQTKESLRDRIGRHLTNQRTDAVAMRVLDPLEVAEIEMWPFWDPPSKPKDWLDRAEFTVYRLALENSLFNVILNEAEIPEKELIKLPASYRIAILPKSRRVEQLHPDVRLARRARTIADLARVISERKVTLGIRRTLLAQAKRLEHMAMKRLDTLE